MNLAADQTETKCKYCDSLVTPQQAEAQFSEVKNSKFGGTLLIAETSREGASYEEAIAFYNKVIEQEPTFAEAWLNKGICMLQTSKIGDLKTTEAISSWKAAIKFAKNPDAMKRRVAKEIESTVSAFYSVLESHYKNFSTLENSYAEHVSRFLKLENALALALELSPTNPDVCTTGINLCEAVLSAATSAGTSNATAALLKKDWEGALSSALGGFSAASAIRKPVEKLKLKYQRGLAAIDPNYKIPQDQSVELDKSSVEGLKQSLVQILELPKGSMLQQIWNVSERTAERDRLLFPKTHSDPSVRAQLQEALSFLGMQSSPEECLLFEPKTNFAVTMGSIGWGAKGITVFKRVISPEKKVVIQRTDITEFEHVPPGRLRTPEAPRVIWRNQFGVKQSEQIRSEFFKTDQRIQKLFEFLRAWRSVAD